MRDGHRRSLTHFKCFLSSFRRTHAPKDCPRILTDVELFVGGPLSRRCDRDRPVDIMMLCRYQQDMRTTLTIDDDIVAKINAEMRHSGKSFKQTVNDALRA